MNTWEKFFVVIEVVDTGTITEEFQVHLTLSEENASVDKITVLLSKQLDFDVTLLESKYLPIMKSDTTTGNLNNQESWFLISILTIFILSRYRFPVLEVV